ncbi:MAG: tRNA-(ms[2]io[6]A)-hydroxylase [Bernardetiaceae bacterium]
MLHLKLPTDPRWADVAQKSLEFILSDHAYCEQKAASTCISLIVQYSDLDELVDTLTPVVAEEWNHFELVLEQLRQRKLMLGKPRKDMYVVRLREFMIKGGDRIDKLRDQLLSCALIEARSCERFKLLSEQLDDPALCRFYYEFMISEARHYTNFISLARRYCGRAETDLRWQAFLDYEAQILATMELRGDRMH